MYQQIRVLGIKSLGNPYWVWFDSSFLQQPSPSMTLLTMRFYQIMPPQAPWAHLFVQLSLLLLRADHLPGDDMNRNINGKGM